jgi:hypothetical protein
MAWLGMGVRSLNMLVRRSRTVAQAQLLDLLQSLRSAMGVRQDVELRSSSEVATAATVGWRKPILLVNNDWAAWSDAELRAVLAHELAHVLRADYATWLVANVSVVMHFYHPFVYWLASRLKLQQELAADAMGALHAGGAHVYRQSLARLVLRQDGLPLPRPARAFLPAQGTLMRRIAMLRDKDVASPTRSSWKVRFGLPAIFGMVALGMSTLRLPAYQDVPAQNLSAANSPARTEFCRAYVPHDADGVLSLRPAEMVARPEIKQLISQHHKETEAAIASLLEEFGLEDVQNAPHVEDVEQVVAGLYFGFNPQLAKGTQHSLVMSGVTIRTTHDYDWKKLITSVSKTAIELAEIQHAGHSYYKVTKSPVSLGIRPICLLIPDSRTVVVDIEKNIQAILDSGNRQIDSWPEGCKRASRSLIAVTFHNENNTYGSRMKGDPSLTPEIASVLKNIQHLVLGIDGQDELTFDARIRCASPAAAASTAEVVKKGLDLAKSYFKNPKSDATADQKAAMLRLQSLINALHVELANSEVGAQAKVKMTIWDLVSGL